MERLPVICLILTLSILVLVLSGSAAGGINHLETARKGVLDEGPASLELLNEQRAEKADINARRIEEMRRNVYIKISFAGDCTLGTDENFLHTGSFPHRLESEGYDYSYFFRGVSSIFEGDDLTLVNLETTLTEAEKSVDKKFRFKGHPSYTKILKQGSIEVVNISNNHIYDYYERGLHDTIKALDDEGIMYCGEGRTAYLQVNGIKIACIGNMVWNPRISEELIRDINTARGNADIVVVTIHWGREGAYYPDEYQRKLGHLCIDEGADIVVGHHPHVIQGIERYRGSYIAYSLGNFCFGGNMDPSDKDTFILQSTFLLKDKKVTDISIEVIPCSISSVDYINDYQPTLLEGSERDRVLSRLAEYSRWLEYGIGRDALD